MELSIRKLGNSALSELMAQCDPKAPMPEDMRAWNEMAPVGKELGQSVTALKGMVRKPAVPVTIKAMDEAIAARGACHGRAF